ncbi:MAG: polysaccharide biosynthesis/export family protein [Candidatus Acidiferrales bacterium]
MARAKVVTIALAIFLFGAATSAFAQKGQPATSAVTSESSTPTSGNSAPQASSDRPALQQRNPRYQVMRDDVLNVSFPLSPELNQTVTIQPDGYITLLNAGSIYVQGLTVPELSDAIKKAYANVLHDPIVNVDLKDFQKPFFVVSGQVGKPGQYDLRSETTVSEGIAVAGGLLPTAKTQILVYHRINSGWFEVHKMSLKDIYHGKNVNEDAELRPGDMIFVPEKAITIFRKYVPYSIGAYSAVNPATF